MAIELISKIKQKNSGQFFLVDATDVDMKSGSPDSNYPDTSLANYLKAIPSTDIVHGESAELLSAILEAYILNIDYETTLKFDTSEIVIGAGSYTDDPSNINNPANAVLDYAVLDTMKLG